MPIINQTNKKELEKFENFLSNARYTSLTQSPLWTEIKSNWFKEYVYIEKNSEIVMAATVLFRKIPIINSYYAFVSDGPAMNEFKIEWFNELVDEIMLLHKKYNFFVLKFNPLIKYEENLAKIITEHGYKLISRETDNHDTIRSRYNFVMNLKNETEDSIFDSFASKTRYNIRLAKRKGVEIHYSRSEEDLQAFYKIYIDTTTRHKIGSRSYSYFKKMLDTFPENDIRIYIATYMGEPISGAVTIHYGGIMTYLYGASSNEYRNTMPNYIMQWEMIKWAIEKKCHSYNMTGVYTLDNSDGLYRFKSGFCRKDGVLEYIGEIDVITNKLLYNIIRVSIPKVKKSHILKFEKINNLNNKYLYKNEGEILPLK